MRPRIAQRREEVEQAAQVRAAVSAVFEQPDRPIMDVLRENLKEKRDV
ncbi:hypothetical protein RCZAHN_116 [Rhodobacter phage RcZahn]|nr:hypothetical protein RCZAHN_116 [Rhodobacter phage RcZahn]